ncbi:MAG TPA: cytochrome P450 [Mycobacteriales bacterium]|nr:cytochrome P450 [Mycobacteriales bacterium]
MTETDRAPLLGNPDFFAADDVHSALAELRAVSPVAWQPQAECWAVTGHREVMEISTDPARFCSGSGVLLADRGRDIAASDSLLYLDPPAHVAYRKLISRGFTPRRVARLEPRIRELTAELLDRIDPTEPVDVVDALTAPLPLLVISELLGVPASDRDDFRRWSDAVMAAATDLNDENAALAMELFVYFDAQLDARQQTPGDDLLSALLAAEVDGERLTRQELLGFCMTLLVAGNETTRNLLTGGLLALAEHPEQRARLAADADLLGPAVEELLRWVTPIMAMARTATGATTVGETTVGRGDYLAMIYGAANRDESAFGDDAQQLNLARSPNPHVAFGFGEHFCLGAGLARLEARVFFGELLARWPDYEVVGEPVRTPSTLLRQIASMPVRFAPLP